MPKTIDQNWVDWESYAFGYGYGSGEPNVISALKRFFELCPADDAYDYQALEAELGSIVAWLLINRLCRHDVSMLSYGTSPRCAWLTTRGKAMKAYLATKTVGELVGLICGVGGRSQMVCYPDACNCGPEGYEEGRKCPNPFWDGVR